MGDEELPWPKGWSRGRNAIRKEAFIAALPTAGMTGLSQVDSLASLSGKVVLTVGAGGAVGSFAPQFAWTPARA
jgi:NADPH-dependent curcumin reductase CurA